MFCEYFRAAVLCIIIFKCCGFNKDYYDDKSDLDIKSSLNNMSRSLGSSDVNISNWEDEIFFKKRERIKDYRRMKYSTSPKKTTSKKYNAILNEHSVSPVSKVQQKYLAFKNLLNDYEEFHSEEDEQLSLRQKDIKSIPIRMKILNDNDTDDFKNPFTMFFNLQPAIQQTITQNNDTPIQKKLWYVLHDFPCWDLPVLYGEIKQHTRNNVFSLYGWKLDNVLDPGIKEHTTFKASTPPMSHTTNKWCEAEPCYADHTLCLFNDDEMATICQKGYKVEVPTITEQITIVNTINSMRNMVANGLSKRYSHLPTAANMRQVIYDYDLEKMSKIWLRQCFPGSAPCSSLDDNLVSELECTKHAKYCCHKSGDTKCIPRTECFIYAVTGCIHVWFWRAGKKLLTTDIKCGRAAMSTFDTVQLLWAKTSKIGCAYAENPDGNVRVICNFAPGAPFFLYTTLYCGIISYSDMRSYDEYNYLNINEETYMALLGLKWNRIFSGRCNTECMNVALPLHRKTQKGAVGGVHVLKKLYGESWGRKQLNAWKNGTYTWIARLVAKFNFIDKSEARCDSDETIYMVGKPGSMCVENGRTFPSLCFDFRDPTPGYRLIAVIAPIVLFSLILYDLFSGVVRQTNY